MNLALLRWWLLANARTRRIEATLHGSRALEDIMHVQHLSVRACLTLKPYSLVQRQRLLHADRQIWAQGSPSAPAGRTMCWKTSCMPSTMSPGSLVSPTIVCVLPLPVEP